MKEQLIYEHGQPYGIRDVNGFHFMFTNVPRFPGQEERYRRELADKVQLADDLLLFFKERASGKEPADNVQQTVTGSQETLTQIAENLEAIAKTVGMYMHKEDENELNDYARQLRLL